MRYFSFSKAAVLMLAGLWLPVDAQQIDFNSLRSVVRLNAPERVAASRSQTVTVDVVATLKPGYHVNSNIAPTYPLKVSLAANPAAQLKNVAFPAPKSHKLGEEILSVFDGDVKLRLTLAVAPNAPVGRTILIGKINYQACDDRACLRPDSIELKLPLDIRN
jgi:DsbC/DsbD-like thiol-disulfide interchange protein